MLMRTAALAGALACAFVGAAQAEPKTNMLHQWSEGSDAAAIAKLGEMFTAAGGKWEQTSIAGHTANTLAKLRADVVAGNAPPAVQLKGPEIAEWNETGKTANLDELAKPRKAGTRSWRRAAAGDEADRPLGRGADEHPSHQLDLGFDQGDGEGGHHVAAEDLGRVQRRLRQGGRRQDHLPRAFQPGLDRRDRFEVVVYGQNIDLFRKAFVEGDTEAMRSPDMVKAFEQMRLMVSKYMDPGDRRPRLRHRHRHDRQGRGRVHDHGRLADRHLHRRRPEGGRRTTSARRRRPTGASPASSSTRTRSCSSSRPIPTISPARSCSRI